MKANFKLISNLKVQLLVTIGFFLSFFYFLQYSSYFWDLEVYQSAVDLYRNGENPYLILKDLKFLYSPIVLSFFNLFGENLSNTLLIFYLISFFIFLRSKFGRLLVIYSLISTVLFFNISLIRSLLTGNITVFIHFILIYIASIKNKYKSEFLFIGALIASIIKPYFGAYTLFILLNKWQNKKKIIYLSAFCLLVICTLFLQYSIYPELFNDYRNSIQSHIMGTSSQQGIDIGSGPYYLFTTIFNNYKAGIFLHFSSLLICAKFILNKFKILRKIIPNKTLEDIYFITLLIFIAFLNPRLKVYDYWIIVSASTSLIFYFYRFISPIKKLFLNKLILFCSVLSISYVVLGKFEFLEINWSLLSKFSLYVPSLLGLLILPFLINKDFQEKNRKIL